MPCYFIDTDDGHTEVVDGERRDLVDDAAARALALAALADMARTGLFYGGPTGSDRRVFSAKVRTEDGDTLYTASLTLSGEWWVRPSSP